MDVFGKYAEVYDALYYDKDYRMECEEVHSLVTKYCDKKDLFMGGCGTGRHDRILSEYGYTIHGIDISSEMIKRADDEKGDLPISYEVADIRNYSPESGKKYSVVLSLFHVISYQTTNDDLLAAFRSIADLLEKDGVFIFDAWYGNGVLRDLPGVRTKKVMTSKYDVLRIANPTMHPNENTVDVHYEILVEDKETNRVERFEEKHTMRYLFVPEVEYYLDCCGLKLVDYLDCKGLGKPTIDTWTSYFIVQHK